MILTRISKALDVKHNKTGKVAKCIILSNEMYEEFVKISCENSLNPKHEASKITQCHFCGIPVYKTNDVIVVN